MGGRSRGGESRPQTVQPFGPNLTLLDSLPPYEHLLDLESQLRSQGKLAFDVVFSEATGYYLLKCFLIADYSVDKAVFVKDVELYSAMRDHSARLKVARLMYARYLSETDSGSSSTAAMFARGQSVFDKSRRRHVVLNLQNDTTDQIDLVKRPDDKANVLSEDDQDHNHLMIQLRIGATNSVGVYGSFLGDVLQDIQADNAPRNLFSAVTQEVLNDLRMDVFPRFTRSPFFQRYIRTKSLERLQVRQRDFTTLRMLGRGAFGSVNACIKNDTGKLYASKCISKRRVMASDSVENILSERNILAAMDSNFVTGLKYSVQDENQLYLVLDLMMGGDLKYHLNREERFSEKRSRFYAAEVLLGLEHIHSKGVIYRDVKLENVLLDGKGHCKVSDLGLALMTNDRVKGYAGTPGYTAPEVILMQSYNYMCDFFSFGVLVYRFLSGRKPFGSHTGSSDLDKNVVSVKPEFPTEYFTKESQDLLDRLMIKDPRKRLGIGGIDEIKNHPWFDSIDWGLLEAGYLEPPFVPKVNMDSLRQYGRPPTDDKYRRVKLTDEFQRTLRNFEFSSVPALQREVVEVMEKADENVNFEKYSRNFAPLPHTVDRPKCCILM